MMVGKWARFAALVMAGASVIGCGFGHVGRGAGKSSEAQAPMRGPTSTGCAMYNHDLAVYASGYVKFTNGLKKVDEGAQSKLDQADADGASSLTDAERRETASAFKELADAARDLKAAGFKLAADANQYWASADGVDAQTSNAAASYAQEIGRFSAAVGRLADWYDRVVAWLNGSAGHPGEPGPIPERDLAARDKFLSLTGC